MDAAPQGHLTPAPRGRAGAVMVLVSLALTAALPGCLAAMTRGSGATELGAPADTGWLHASTGLSFGDTLQLDDAVTLESVTSLFALGIGAHYRTRRIDVGALFEAHGGQRSAGLSRDNPVGSSFRAAATLRWRYIEEPWGAFFVRLAPAMMVLGHSDALRFQVGRMVGRDLSAVDDHSLAFSLGLDFGLLFYLSERIALSVHVDLVTVTTSLGTPVRDVGYNSIRGLFVAGLEWRI